MIFETIDGNHIDVAKAERIHVGWRVVEAQKCWVVFVNIGDRRHALVSTGGDRRQATFYRDALRQNAGVEGKVKAKVEGEDG